MGRISRRTLVAGAGSGTAALLLPGCSSPGTDRTTGGMR